MRAGEFLSIVCGGALSVITTTITNEQIINVVVTSVISGMIGGIVGYAVKKILDKIFYK